MDLSGRGGELVLVITSQRRNEGALALGKVNELVSVTSPALAVTAVTLRDIFTQSLRFVAAVLSIPLLHFCLVPSPLFPTAPTQIWTFDVYARSYNAPMSVLRLSAPIADVKPVLEVHLHELRIVRLAVSEHQELIKK